MKKQANIDKLNAYISNLLKRLQSIDIGFLSPVNTFIEKNKYTRLMRLHRPEGYLLLMYPCLWTIAFATRSFIEIFLTSLLFIFGAIIMRSAGCIINDILDRDIDKDIERTKNRPLASGEVSLKEAFILLFFLLVISFLILITLPNPAIIIGAFGIIPILIYPLLKRYTDFPQVFLGFVFNIGVLMAWATVSGRASYNPILIYLSSVLWTIGYDTIYAMQDKEEDLRAGVRSLALRLQDRAPEIILMMYQMSSLMLFITGLNTHMNLGFFIVMGLACYHLYWQVETLDVNDPIEAGNKFKSNVQYGLLVLIATWIGRINF
jgi:4-hydroxybenzoate polyprenyl transferase